MKTLLLNLSLAAALATGVYAADQMRDQDRIHQDTPDKIQQRDQDRIHQDTPDKIQQRDQDRIHQDTTTPDTIKERDQDRTQDRLHQ